MKSDFNLKSVLDIGGIQTTVLNLTRYTRKNIVEIGENTAIMLYVDYHCCSIFNC